METVFYSYTIAIMLVCAAASTAMAASYAITRNRIYLFAAISFVLYFFDLTFIFQSEYLNHGAGIDSAEFYVVNDPVVKTLLAAGILESLWLGLQYYFGKPKIAAAIAPAAAFVATDFLIVCLMPESPVKQWCFYSSREAFLLWCIGYVVYKNLSADTPPKKALATKLKTLTILGAALCLCIISENTLMILVWKPSAEAISSVLPLYISERNISENVLVLVFAAFALRRSMEILRLRHKDPPDHGDERERYIAETIDAYCARHDLTKREREVLLCIVSGKDYQNTAHELQLAVGTVKSHTHNILKKTQTSTRQELLQDFWKN